MFIVHIAGHLGKNPETRYTPSGQKVSTFALATNQRKGKEDVTMWVRVTVWGDHLDKMLSCLTKGSGVMVVGRMMPPSSYTDKEGRTQISLEVTAQMIEFSPFGRTDRQGENTQSPSATTASYESTAQYQETNAPQYGGKTPNTQYASQTTGQGNRYSVDEDTLPF